jgi:Trk-type K+ transport systems, membrane components
MKQENKVKSFLLKFDLERLLTFGYVSKLPQRNLLMGYFSYIVFGLIFLMMPFSQRVPISIVDNLFNVTSAISTTGLATVNLCTDYTYFGQFIMLLLIQLGGIGYMTLSSYILYRMTHHFMRIKNGVMRTSFTLPAEFNMQELVRDVVKFTFFIELVGAILLWILFADKGTVLPLWNGIFISISSFCTAGFSLFNNSLTIFDTNIGVNIVVSILSIIGAMGFIFIRDVMNKIRNIHYSITFTTKVICSISLVLTIVGTLQIFFFEPSIAHYNIGNRLMIGFFHTVAAWSTSGFNTVNLGAFNIGSLSTLSALMFIGSSPSGTGGGVKSTTLSAVLAFVFCKLGDKRDIRIGKHRIPTYRVDSALTDIIFYGLILFIGTYILTYTENFSFTQILVETTSALGTVGLTTGITANLSDAGKIILTILMYIGRVGVLTFGNAMLIRMSNKEKNTVNADIAI